MITQIIQAITGWLTEKRKSAEIGSAPDPFAASIAAALRDKR